MSSSTDEYIARKDLAKIVGISERTFARNDRSWGLTPLNPTGRLVKYRKADADAFLARRDSGKEVSLSEQVEVLQQVLASAKDRFTDEEQQQMSSVIEALSLFIRPSKGEDDEAEHP